jgi:hypothetical protein
VGFQGEYCCPEKYEEIENVGSYDIPGGQGCHGLFGAKVHSCYVVSFPPWYIYFSPSKEGQCYVECSRVHIAHILMLFKGHSFNECIFLHLGKNIDMVGFCSCFFLTYNVSICKLRVPRMQVLKFSNKFPNSSLITQLLDVDLEILGKESQDPLLDLAWLHEYFMHISEIMSKDSWEISPTPIKLSTFIESFEIALKKMVLLVLVFNLFYWDL